MITESLLDYDGVVHLFIFVKAVISISTISSAIFPRPGETSKGALKPRPDETWRYWRWRTKLRTCVLENLNRFFEVSTMESHSRIMVDESIVKRRVFSEHIARRKMELDSFWVHRGSLKCGNYCTHGAHIDMLWCSDKCWSAQVQIKVHILMDTYSALS